jgi:hypothetical protein
LLTLCGAGVSAWALADRAIAAAALLGSMVILVVVRSLWESGISTAVMTEAVHGAESQRVDSNGLGETVPLATTPATADSGETHLMATG